MLALRAMHTPLADLRTQMQWYDDVVGAHKQAPRSECPLALPSSDLFGGRTHVHADAHTLCVCVRVCACLRVRERVCVCVRACVLLSLIHI